MICSSLNLLFFIPSSDRISRRTGTSTGPEIGGHVTISVGALTRAHKVTFLVLTEMALCLWFGEAW